MLEYIASASQSIKTSGCKDDPVQGSIQRESRGFCSSQNQSSAQKRIILNLLRLDLDLRSTDSKSHDMFPQSSRRITLT